MNRLCILAITLFLLAAYSAKAEFSTNCETALKLVRTTSADKLTDDLIKKAFLALEANGYRIGISLFRRPNPTLNAIISDATEKNIDMNTLYYSLF